MATMIMDTTSALLFGAALACIRHSWGLALPWRRPQQHNAKNAGHDAQVRQRSGARRQDEKANRTTKTHTKMRGIAPKCSKRPERAPSKARTNRTSHSRDEYHRRENARTRFSKLQKILDAEAEGKDPLSERLRSSLGHTASCNASDYL